jgi:hypothetical protein
VYVVGVEILAQTRREEGLGSMMLKGKGDALTHEPQRTIRPEDLAHFSSTCQIQNKNRCCGGRTSDASRMDAAGLDESPRRCGIARPLCLPGQKCQVQNPKRKSSPAAKVLPFFSGPYFGSPRTKAARIHKLAAQRVLDGREDEEHGRTGTSVW